MGQALSGWKREVEEEGSHGSLVPSDSDSRGSVDTTLIDEDVTMSSDEEFEDAVEHEPLESLADEFMKKKAFSEAAELYGIEDEYLSGDVPMEVC